MKQDTLYLFIFNQILGYVIAATENGYCMVEHFNPRCAADEVIIMTEAKYGHIKLGRCIEEDFGYFGCYGNVIELLDNVCSGKQSCDVLVGSNDMGRTSSCRKGLLQYLEATYICRKVLQIPQQDCGRPARIILTEHETIITSDVTEQRRSCISLNEPFTVSAKSGQVLNVTLIDFDHGIEQGHVSQTYGKINDLGGGGELSISGDERINHLVITNQHDIGVTIYTSSKFALSIEVLGCGDLSPPVGAWMTRDGDITELGCHSGKHTWTLECIHDQWVGAVGYCGSVSSDVEQKTQHEVTPSKVEVSTNIIVFGVCSLVLLFSSIIFLTGVLFLRKHKETSRAKYVYQPAIPVMVPTNKDLMMFDRASPSLHGSMIGTLPVNNGRMTTSQDYKSLQI